MMKLKNETHIEGYLYEHALEKKQTGPNSKNPGTDFIAGTISIATDEACLNIVPVHFTYVTANPTAIIIHINHSITSLSVDFIFFLLSRKINFVFRRFFCEIYFTLYLIFR